MNLIGSFLAPDRKSQLPQMIGILFRCGDSHPQPYIYECSRRILNVTGNFFQSRFTDIYHFRLRTAPRSVPKQSRFYS
jgi:hypothetical protein